jgi:putative hydrolase of HD superfamily
VTASKEIIELIKHSETLKRISRTGWSLAGVDHARQESVGEHTFGTVLISSLIAKAHVNQGDQVDLAKVVVMSAIHDVAESITSDIPRVATNIGGEKLRREKEEAEKKAMKAISNKSMHFGPWLNDLWSEIIEKKSIESRIVLGADIIDMLAHAISLETSGVSPKILNQFFVSSKEALTEIDLEVVEDIFWNLYDEHIANAKRLGMKLNRITM